MIAIRDTAYGRAADAMNKQVRRVRPFWNYGKVANSINIERIDIFMEKHEFRSETRKEFWRIAHARAKSRDAIVILEERKKAAKKLKNEGAEQKIAESMGENKSKIRECGKDAIEPELEGKKKAANKQDRSELEKELVESIKKEEKKTEDLKKEAIAMLKNDCLFEVLEKSMGNMDGARTIFNAIEIIGGFVFPFADMARKAGSVSSAAIVLYMASLAIAVHGVLDFSVRFVKEGKMKDLFDETYEIAGRKRNVIDVADFKKRKHG